MTGPDYGDDPTLDAPLYPDLDPARAPAPGRLSYLRREYGPGKAVSTLVSLDGLTRMLAELRRRSPGTELP